MTIARFTARIGYSVLGALTIAGISQTGALAQDTQTHKVVSHHVPSPESKDRTNALVRLVRESTRRFQDASVALAEGYVPQFGCVSGSHEGAMGVHFVNGPLVADPELDPARPELLVYEPLPNNKFRLVAVDYLVVSQAWNANNPGPPELMGQLFHLFESPNRFGLPEFYTLHVWAWKENPQGTFANWNPDVSCDAYNPSGE